MKIVSRLNPLTFPRWLKKPTLLTLPSHTQISHQPKISHQKFSWNSRISNPIQLVPENKHCKIWADLPNQQPPRKSQSQIIANQSFLLSLLHEVSFNRFLHSWQDFLLVNCELRCAMTSSSMMRGTVLRPCARVVSRRMLCTVEKRALTQLVSISGSRPATFFPRYSPIYPIPP